MRGRWIAVALVALVPAYAGAQGGASEESIRELIEVTQMQTMLDEMLAQMEQAMKSGMLQAAEGRPLTEAQKAIFAEESSILMAKMTSWMSWDVLEPMYVEVYQKSFTQAEIDAMLGFYRTAEGQAVIGKMPVVMKNSMAAMQSRLGEIVPELQQLVSESAERMKAASAAVASR